MSQSDSTFLQKLLAEYLCHQDPSDITRYVAELKESHPERLDPSSIQEANECAKKGATNSLAKSELADKTEVIEIDGAVIHTLDVAWKKLDDDLAMEDTLYPRIHQRFYNNKGVLGRGGMGFVLKVEDPSLKRSVALKTLASDQEELAFFQREAEIAAKLGHPGVIPIYEYGSLEDGTPYFTMQEARGRTLQEVIHDIHHSEEELKPEWSLRKIIEVFRSVCETIAYAHSQSVLHRDLKPQNIMVGEFGEIYVVDWGIAVMMKAPASSARTLDMESDASIPSFIAGTPLYMSPEQARGDLSSFQPTSDIYSLGVILFKILTGKNIAVGDVRTVLAKKSGFFSVPLDEILQEQQRRGVFPFGRYIPSTLVLICQKALAFDWKERYQSCQTLVQDLQDWLDGVDQKSYVQECRLAFEALEKEQLELEATWTQKMRTLSGDLAKDKVSERQWSLWKEQDEIVRKIEQNNQQMYNLLQTSLMCDPENYDLWESLLQLQCRKLQQPHQDKRAFEEVLTEGVFRSYVRFLPEDTRQRWMRRLQKLGHFIDKQPSFPSRYIGHTDLQEQILVALQPGEVVSLVGQEGIGKTHLAWVVSQQWMERHQAEVVCCDVERVVDIPSLLFALAYELEIPLQKEPQQSLLQAVENRGRILLVLDNCHQAMQAVQQFLPMLLQKAPQLSVLLCSSRVLDIASHVVRIPELPLIDALLFFVERLKSHREFYPRNEEQFAQILEIVECLAGVPLALQLVAAGIRRVSLSGLNKSLTEVFSSEVTVLEQALEWSWLLLLDVEKRAIKQMLCFRQGFRLSAAESVLAFQDEEEFSVVEIVDRLHKHGFLRRERTSSSERYFLPEVVGRYVHKKIEDAEEVPDVTARRRHAQYYVEYAKSYLAGERSPRELMVEQENLNVIVEQGAEAAVDVCLRALLHSIDDLGSWSIGLHLIEQFVGQRSGSFSLLQEISIQKIRFLRRLGNIDEADKQMQELSEKPFQTPYLQGLFFRERGQISEARSQLKEALPFFQDAMESFRKDGFEDEALGVQLDYIDVLCKLGEYQKATELAERIQKKVLSSLRRFLQARYYQTKATIHQSLGQYEQGGEYIHTALKNTSRAHYPRFYIGLLLQRGTIFTLAGQYEQAIRNHQEALVLNRKIGDKRQEARCLITLGVCYKSLHDYEKAEQMYRRALLINEEIGHLRGLVVLYLNISQILPLLQRQHEVEGVLQKALQITATLQDKRLKALLHSNLGRHFFQVGEIGRSELHYKRAVDINAEIGHRKGLILNLGNYGNTLKYFKRWPEAETAYKKAIAMCADMNILFDELIITGNLGELYWEMAHLERAKEVLSDVYVRAEAAKLRLLQAVFGGTLALLQALEANFPTAYQILRETEPYIAQSAEEHAIFLAKKAWIYQLDNRHDRATEIVQELQSMIGSLEKNTNWVVRALLQQFWKR